MSALRAPLSDHLLGAPQMLCAPPPRGGGGGDRYATECILWMNQYKSAVVVRRKFRTKYPNYRHNIPSRTVIRTWYSRFSETGRIDQGNEHRGRPPVRPQIVEAIDNIYKENPSTSIRQAAQQVPICKTSVHKVVRKKIKL